MSVELDAFSGLPNPSWSLSPHESDELARRLKDLRPLDPMPVQPYLGYRGFVLWRAEGEILVFRGAVVLPEGGATRVYADDRRIESWLMEQAKQRGYGGVFAGDKGHPDGG